MKYISMKILPNGNTPPNNTIIAGSIILHTVIKTIILYDNGDKILYTPLLSEFDRMIKISRNINKSSRT